jgi:hypothetical protein
MVNVDRVYQRVLALANKEQRGYITPQEFNLLANHAQMDIFEQYFYDLNQFRRLNGNDTVHSDMVTILEEKIQIFHLLLGSAPAAALTSNNNSTAFLLPDNTYRLDQVRLGPTQCERLNIRDFNEVRMSPLTRATPSRPIYTVRRGNEILINNGGAVNIAEEDANGDLVNPCNMVLLRVPEQVSWGFTMVNGVAMYNAGLSANFELHPSEESDLVMKILALSGITIKDQGLYGIGSKEDISNTQQEKQ